MNRRDFLRRAGLIAAGIVAADQIELLERLAPRRLWAGWTASTKQQWAITAIDDAGTASEALWTITRVDRYRASAVPVEALAALRDRSIVSPSDYAVVHAYLT